MANIYNITAELEDIFLELEENGGELTPELEERLAITQDNLKSLGQTLSVQSPVHSLARA